MTMEQNRTSAPEHEDLSQIIRIDEAKVSGHLNDLVRTTVQETVNEMLDAEAQALCHAQRYERTEARTDCRAGFCQRKLQTQAGEVQLTVSDRYVGLVEAAAEFYPQARWQRCVVHWYRNLFSDVPTTKVKEVTAMLKSIHA